jgi:hypothetical protein
MFQEPLLAVAQPRSFFMRRRFLRSFLPVAFLAVTGLIALLVSGIPLALPFERLIVLTGQGGSNIAFLEDAQVAEVLRRHHIRAQGDNVGSRAAANGKSPGDFIFVSGQPAADQVLRERLNGKPYHPFISPIVLATFRDYAETLSANRIATPRTIRPPFDRPYYYDLHMGDFLNLGNASWDKLKERPLSNTDAILGQFTDLCTSNGADTYLGLVSFVKHGRVPTNEREAIDFANDIKPLLRSQGLPFHIPEWKYFSELGRQVAPIVVMYEHQWLAGQLDHIKRFHTLYDDRVLLYPDPQFTTESAFIALNENAKQLGELLETNPDLRIRALELGFRALTRPGTDPSEPLSTFLAENGVPVPPTPVNTNAKLPDNYLLNKMVNIVGDCP